MSRFKQTFSSNLFFSVFLIAAACLGSMAATPATNTRVLILYDSSGEFGWIGKIHARQLSSLLGHFPVQTFVVPVEKLGTRNLDSFHATFYLGNTYENKLPQQFLDQVARTKRPLCWLKYNLWKVPYNTLYNQFGIRFLSLDSSGYLKVRYKSQTFTKFSADPEVGKIDIVDGSIAKAVATVCKSDGGDCVPYIVRSQNLWYVADLPFPYMTEDSRYVAFSDVLHDILGMDHAVSRRALIRIEDVNPKDSPEQLRAIADFLAAEKVPFAVTVTPVYSDPRGHYSGGASQWITLSQAPEVANALKYMVSKGGSILLHGYTHQYGSTPNPYTGVTGDDYEFFQVQLDAQGNTIVNRPVPEDSDAWIKGRISAALDELENAGLTAEGWVTPHYAASARDYRFFAKTFPFTAQRLIYFPRSPETPGTNQPSYFASQFFPYVIQRDHYGQKVLPENLGLVLANRLPKHLISLARKNKVVRDGWASAYYDPVTDINYLKTLVRGIKNAGYTFVPFSADY